MALARTRDPEAVMAGFERWLREREPSTRPTIVHHERPSAGFSSETYLVDVTHSGADATSGDRLVLKLPPVGPGGFPEYDFGLQARVQDAVATAGIPAPSPAVAEQDTSWLGAPFLVMPAVDGHIVSQLPLADHWLTRVDPSLASTAHRNYVDTVAGIHRIDWRSAGLDEIVPARDNAAEIAYWRTYLDWYADGVVLLPQLVEALDWCDGHRPATDPDPALLWGDVRLGNLVYDEERRPIAVLDWEMTTIGAPEHDVAWTLALDGAQDELFGRTVPGFLDHAAVVERYQQGAGRVLLDLGWYEVLALVRSVAIMSRIGHLHDLAGEPGPFPLADNPILGILQRRIDAATV
jgi:aminoglycoside phosphotransferase (APT) family kinase protein